MLPQMNKFESPINPMNSLSLRMNSLSLHRRDEALKPATECTMGTGDGAGRGPAGRPGTQIFCDGT